MTCLIIDNSRVMRRVAARLIEELGFETSEAEDGHTALEMCRQSMPAIILVDCHMTTMPCNEFLRTLRSQDLGHKPLILLCTTENDHDTIAMALSNGANDFLLKPFDGESIKGKFAELNILAHDTPEHARR